MTAARWMAVGIAPVLLLATACAVGLGDPCSAQAPCPQGLVCNFPPAASSGVCDYPLRVEGEPCTRAAECEAAFTCSNHFTPGDRYGTCVPKREDGAPCFADRDCQSGNCAGESGTALDGVCSPRP